MNKSDIKYIALLAPLFYLYGTFFLWSQNAHMFHLYQYVYSFMLVFTIAVVLYVVVYSLLRIIYSKVNYSKKLQTGIAFCIALLTGLIGNFCFFKTIFFPNHHAVMYGIMAIVFIIIYYHLIKKLVIFLVILLIFNFGFNGYNNLYTLYKIQQDFYGNLPASDDNYLIKFKDKPNIYLFWLEAFHGTRTLTNTFKINTAPLINYLNKQNFSICENMYSNAAFTLFSMTDLYSLGNISSHNYFTASDDAIQPIRNLLGGGRGNILFKVLKYNNYTTNIITNGLYYFYQKGEYLDYCPILDTTDPLQIQLLPSYYFTKLYEKMDTINRFYVKAGSYNQLPLKKQIENQIDKMQEMNTPFFLVLKEDTTFHSPIRGAYTYFQRDSWIKSGGYKEAFEKCCKEDIQEITNMILEKDKNAIIVMIGDHGTRTYRGIYEDLSVLEKNNISLSDFVDDNFNVFCAIHLPDNYAKFSFENGDTYINHSNIFIQIFSLLAQNPEYLKLQKIPHASIFNNTLVVNGKIINNTK